MDLSATTIMDTFPVDMEMVEYHGANVVDTYLGDRRIYHPMDSYCGRMMFLDHFLFETLSLMAVSDW